MLYLKALEMRALAQRMLAEITLELACQAAADFARAQRAIQEARGVTDAEVEELKTRLLGMCDVDESGV